MACNASGSAKNNALTAMIKALKKADGKFKMLVFVMVGLPIIPLLSYPFIQSGGNFHPVTENVLYRSAQLDESQLILYIRKYDIKTIVNLRGKDEGADWYKQEKNVCQRFGVAHFDHGISAGEELSPAEIDRLVALIKESPKAVLIHCQAGADRSGLIAAAWKLGGEGEPPAQARKQLSLAFGHFPFLWSESGAMDRSFARYVEHLRK